MSAVVSFGAQRRTRMTLSTRRVARAPVQTQARAAREMEMAALTIRAKIGRDRVSAILGHQRAHAGPRAHDRATNAADPRHAQWARVGSLE